MVLRTMFESVLELQAGTQLSLMFQAYWRTRCISEITEKEMKNSDRVKEKRNKITEQNE